MVDFRPLHKEIMNKINNGEMLYCNNDDEFAYACGLLVRYALRVGSRGSTVSQDKISEIARQSQINPSKFKDKVLFIHKQAGQGIPLDNKKYSAILAAVAGYELDNPAKINDNAFILATASDF